LIESITATARNFKDWQDGMLYFANDFIENNLIKNKNNHLLIDKNSFGKLPTLVRVCVLQVLTNSIGSLRKPQIENIKDFLNKEVIGNKCFAINGFVILNDRDSVIINRKKQGFRVPITRWFSDALGLIAEQKLRDFCKRTDYFRWSSVSKLIYRQDDLVWYLLNFVLWHELWIEGVAREDLIQLR